MSSSNLYYVYKTFAREHAEFSNGHGSATPIWEWLGRHFLGYRKGEYIFSKDLKPLWRLIDNPAVPIWARITHGFTFDGAVLTKENFPKAIKAFREAQRVLIEWPEWGPSRVLHWGAIADSLESMKIRNNCLGAGLSCTSVSDPWIGDDGRLNRWDFMPRALSKSLTPAGGAK